MGDLNKLKADLERHSSLGRKKTNEWFFKTGKGEYGEGDKFMGVSSFDQRLLAKKYKALPLSDLQKLLNSKIHEHRQTALRILTLQFEKGDPKTRQNIFKFYLKNTRNINNWDLVDVSVHKILGAYLLDKDKKILYKLAKSKNLWERRMAVVSTAHFISKGELDDTFKIAEILLYDRHDLIHKAVGWMLREAGKKDEGRLLKFLNKHRLTIPRTALRYAIEKMPPAQRKELMKK